MPVLLETSIDINASATAVWKVFSGFAAYPDWNPFIRKLEGNSFIAGNALKVTLQPPGGKQMVFQPVLLKNEPEKEFRWKGKLLLPGIFDGEHYFRIEVIDTYNCKFVQGEKFSGILVPLVPKVLRNTKKGFESMNEALKVRAENQDLSQKDTNR